MPRAATSVATSTFTMPLRNRAMMASRSIWRMSPCSPAAENPRLCKLVTTFSTPSLVLQNTSASFVSSRTSSRASSSPFWKERTEM